MKAILTWGGKLIVSPETTLEEAALGLWAEDYFSKVDGSQNGDWAVLEVWLTQAVDEEADAKQAKQDKQAKFEVDDGAQQDRDLWGASAAEIRDLEAARIARERERKITGMVRDRLLKSGMSRELAEQVIADLSAAASEYLEVRFRPNIGPHITLGGGADHE